jgi:hypothetical protein
MVTCEDACLVFNSNEEKGGYYQTSAYHLLSALMCICPALEYVVDATDPLRTLHMVVCDCTGAKSDSYRAVCRKATILKKFDTALHNALASGVEEV